jgi:hypothetical protein
MKKPKFKLDGPSIKKFCVLHCEKIVLVLVLGVMAWLVYSGYALPGLDSNKTPKALSNNSNQTKTFIDAADRWTLVKDERLVPLDLEDRVDRGQTPSDPRGYVFPFPWKPENFPKLSPRTDPALLAPVKLRVIPIRGPLFSYWEGETDSDPLKPEPSDDDAKAKRTKKNKQRPGSGSAGMYGPSDGADYGASGTGYAGGPSRGGPKRGSRRSSRGSGSSSMSSGSGGYSDPAGSDDAYSAENGMAGMGSAYGSGYGAGAAGGLNPESIFGFEGDYSSGKAVPTNAMVVQAVVPYEEQAEIFLNSLSSSLDYEPARDQPSYLGFLVERAEIPADNLEADPASLEWTKISPKALSYEQLGNPLTGQYGTWAGVLTDVADPTYLDPKLTHPAPPFMQRDIWSLLVHPDVPLATMATSSGMYNEGMPGMRPQGQGNETPASDAPIDDAPGLPGMGVPGAAGSYGGDGYSDTASSGMPGMGSSGMMRPPMMGSGGGSRSMLGRPSGSSGMYGTGSASMGSSGMGSAAMAGGGSGYEGYGSAATFVPPKYKLVRFTDTHVEEGKYYRYRLKVQLHDPNHPAQGYPPPSLASLAPEVQSRVTALDAADAKMPERAKGIPWRTYWVESDWSQPSEVATLPLASNYFAGSVNQPATAVVVEGKPRLPNDQPSATVLTTVWDQDKVVDVPIEQKVYRGSVLNFVEDAKVIHPVTHEVLDLEKYKFKTGALVADMIGGEVVSSRNASLEEPLRAPGEVLVVDANGVLHVQDETTDIENFRRYTLPKEEKLPPGSAPGSSGYDPAEGGYGASSAPGYGMPSPRGGRPARGRGRSGSSEMP